MRYIRKVPKHNLVFVYTSMQGKIEKELAPFHIKLESNKPSSKQHTARYITATTSSSGTGVNLGEAISVRFLEPDYHLDAFYRAAGATAGRGIKISSMGYSLSC